MAADVQEECKLYATRILVVDDHAILRKNLIDFLLAQEDVELVGEAANGIEALKCLSDNTFDVIVTDLVMPMMDGYTFMEELSKLALEPMPKIIIISALGRDDFVLRAIDMGAKFFMVKPFEPEHLYGHIKRMNKKISKNGKQQSVHISQPEPLSLDEQLGSLFLSIGIPAHIKGYQFLRTGIRMLIDHPDIINHITKELYPGIAAYFDTSASKVERDIRHAIGVAWNRGRVDSLNSLLGCKVFVPEERPTNGEFMAMLADKFGGKRSAYDGRGA